VHFKPNVINVDFDVQIAIPRQQSGDHLHQHLRKLDRARLKPATPRFSQPSRKSVMKLPANRFLRLAPCRQGCRSRRPGTAANDLAML